MIISDSSYRDSFESTGSVGSAGTFGPAPGQQFVISSSQVDWNSTIQMATTARLMDMLKGVEGKVDKVVRASDGLKDSINLVEGRLTAHATKFVLQKAEIKADIDAHNQAISSEINGMRDEMQMMEKRLIDRLDALTESHKTFLDRILDLFKQY
ncbi:hypothetical protein BDR06DRAFT_977731 [Suillus hirtellus]|nr:hypothetical protein BDR06DRAFT_977731 [Suillus hirtellus]